MNFLYARCSTKQQNEARQLVYAQQMNIPDENIFIDKKSGKNTDRPALKDVMSRLREGDTLYITELSRLGRNTKDLLDLVEKLNKKGVALVSQKETIDTSTPTGKFIFHIFASLAEFQREIINENASAGREASTKPAGRPKVDENKLNQALDLFANNPGLSVANIVSLTGISRATIYNKATERGIMRASK